MRFMLRKRSIFRRAFPWLFCLVLGLILFLPKDILDRSGQVLLASGWFGTGTGPATPGLLPHPPA